MTTSDRAGNEERLREALTKINAIRDSIVGAQSINWSEHIYPLVAALNEAGFEGLPYPEARENIGTLIERAERAEAALAATPTQSGAEGPALDWLGKVIDAHTDVCPILRTASEGGAETDLDSAFHELRAALRSGAEVAAAPGLSEALAAITALATKPAAACPDCTADGEPCIDAGMVRDALRDLYAARLTAKP